MSYKKFNDLQNLYEGVVSESNEIDEDTELVYNVIIAEMVYRGHSESVIETYLENISEEQILEKVESFFSLEEYNLNEEQTDLLFSFYQDQQLISESGGLLKFLDKGKHLSKLKNLKNVNVLKNIKGSGAKLKNMIMSLVGKGKGSTKQLNLDLKGAKDGPGLLQKLKNLKTSTGNQLNKVKSKFDRKVTKTSDTLLGPDGKPLKSTKTVNPFNKKNAAIVGGLGVVGGAATLTGGDKKGDSKKVPADKTENGKSSGLSFGDAIKAAQTEPGKELTKSIQTPKKKNAAGVEMTGSGTKEDPWISKAVKGKDKYIPMTDPKNPHYYKGIEKGLPNKADWLKKTANSPAAKAFGDSDEANEKRWQQQLKHRQWQKDNNRGPFKAPKEKAKTYTNKLDAFVNNKKVGDKKGTGNHKITQWQDLESFEPTGEVLSNEHFAYTESLVEGNIEYSISYFSDGIDIQEKFGTRLIKNQIKRGLNVLKKSGMADDLGPTATMSGLSQKMGSPSDAIKGFVDGASDAANFIKRVVKGKKKFKNPGATPKLTTNVPSTERIPQGGALAVRTPSTVQKVKDAANAMKPGIDAAVKTAKDTFKKGVKQGVKGTKYVAPRAAAVAGGAQVGLEVNKRLNKESANEGILRRAMELQELKFAPDASPDAGPKTGGKRPAKPDIKTGGKRPAKPDIKTGPIKPKVKDAGPTTPARTPEDKDAGPTTPARPPKSPFKKATTNAPNQDSPTQKEEYVDAFDLVLEHLVETQQVDSIEEALYVMMEMDQNAIYGIVQERSVLPGKVPAQAPLKAVVKKAVTNVKNTVKKAVKGQGSKTAPLGKGVKGGEPVRTGLPRQNTKKSTGTKQSDGTQSTTKEGLESAYQSIYEKNFIKSALKSGVKAAITKSKVGKKMPAHVKDSIKRQYKAGTPGAQPYTIEDKKNVINWYKNNK